MNETLECDFSNETLKVLEWSNFIVFNVFLPAYVIIGLSGNIILLIAFYKQSKIDQPYAYQVLLTFNKALELVTFGAFETGIRWFSVDANEEMKRFKSGYLLVFITAELGFVLHIHFIISSLLLAAAMAADRVFALALPIQFQKKNHTLHIIVAAIICFSLPSVISFWNLFCFDLVPNGDIFEQRFKRDLCESHFQLIFSITMSLRVFALIFLITMNIFMIIYYRKRRNKAAQTTNQQERHKAMKAANKTLFLLNIWQSVLMCFNQIPHVTLMGSDVFSPVSVRCYVPILSLVADTLIILTDSVDLGVILLINKKMRRLVFKAVRCQ